ncbi:PorP/SprF family type IX secretion system membrane protein [Patiriisocius marinus]|uniref:Membrane protein n=1 Tax=Patiriisocius marinus TaxID=1397112 RepID=A0A5J4IQW9_9FLAO|nr:type IX secretion system membrane protein PorP/SprF [Patiriisocius marinus]GER60295.1 membrane protein [Patiriisocius marinus]
MKHSYYILILAFVASVFTATAQQDPQYTQYMYNTQIVNPGYAGSKEALSFGLLLRTQWVGLDGAPQTGTFTVDSPIGVNDNMGLGLSIVHDQIGPANETNFTVDYSYTIKTSDEAKLSFGLKAGAHILDVDFARLNIFDQGDPRFQNNVDNKFQPQIGAGLYYHTQKFYAGLSVPNFLTTNHFDVSSLENSTLETTPQENLHYFLIMGYVFDINENLKLKPAVLGKVVGGAPLAADLSLNALINEKFTLGVGYRWSAALSAMAGFQVSDSMFIGLGYDYQSTELEQFSDGSYELMLRFDVFKKPERVLTPRFF